MKAYRYLTLGLVFLILISFFLPWVSVQAGKEGRLQALTTRGFRISMISKSPDANYLLAVSKEFSIYLGNVKRTGELVWVYPMLALIVFCLVYLFGEIRFVNLIISFLCAIVFLTGMYKIYSWNLDKLFYRLTPLPGFWLTLYSFLGIAVLAALNLFDNSSKKVKK